MKELEIREEICRLVSMKGCTTYSLGSFNLLDFDFVRYANRGVRAVDGDTNLGITKMELYCNILA